jgi:hypothetical protein
MAVATLCLKWWTGLNVMHGFEGSVVSSSHKIDGGAELSFGNYGSETVRMIES